MPLDPIAQLPFLHTLGFFVIPLVLALVVWTLIIKGIALWRSARNGDKVWFVALLIVNTFGILELVYLIWFSGKKREVSTTPLSSPIV